MTALKIVRDGLVGSQIAGAIGVAGDLRNPRTDDPDWWAQVQDDYVSGVKVGELAASGIPGIKYGLEKTITPTTMRWFNNVFNPRMSIPDAAAQVAAGTRANGIHAATQVADIVGYGGRKEFGKAGTGLNTAKAAAFAEKNRTLVGFVADDGVTTVTPAQEAWLQERLAYEDTAQARLDAAKVLGPTQNVVTSGSLPGPKVHITHLYDQEVEAAKRAASRGQGRSFGWRDSNIVKPRDKTISIDPSVDPNTPRTIEESLQLFAKDKLTNPKPLDDLVTRFEVSAYQTERTLANRNFYSTINPPGKGRLTSPVVRPAKLAPDDWVRPKDEWGLGPRAKNFRFEPNLATYMDNVSGAAESAPWLEWFGEHAAAPLKGMLFGGSVVHAFNVAHRVNSMLTLDKTAELFRSYIIPTVKGGYGETLLANPGLAIESAEAGLTPARYAAEGITPQWGLMGNLARTGFAAAGGGGAAWTQAKARGESDEEAKHQAFLGAAVASPMFIPGLGKGIIKALGKDVDVDVAASFADVLHHAIFARACPPPSWACTTS